MFPIRRLNILLVMAAILLAACETSTTDFEVITPVDESATPGPTSKVSFTPRPIPVELTNTPARIFPSPTSTPAICSPFPGYLRDDLIASISNPFHPPRPGSDDPHQGVDLAVQQDGIALPGGNVLTVLSGQVAAVIIDRFPYGNALMVETPVEALPASWSLKFQLPTPVPTLPPHPALTCPPAVVAPDWSQEKRSLYLLYAHMQKPPSAELGDLVSCGALIGQIGQSGNALNPHLHLEARLGPAGARFNSIAHYVANATPQEMSYYCTWRVSGIFQLVDPVLLLGILP